MSTNTPTTTEITGDAYIDRGSHDEPVRLEGAEDVYVKEGAISGDLLIENAEYVYTATQAGDSTTIEPETILGGSIEDAYFEHDGAQDVIIADVEDVFIEPGAVAGNFEINGAENVFKPTRTVDSFGDEHFDAAATGWQQSQTIHRVSDGYSHTGARGTSTIKQSDDPIDILVTGYDNKIVLTGANKTYNLYFIGRNNTVETGPQANVTVVCNAGSDNTCEEQAFSPSDIIDTPKKTAYRNAGTGISTVTYEQPAENAKYCENCGTNADTVVESVHEKAVFISGHRLFALDTTHGAHKCSDCAVVVNLSEDERQDVYQ